MGRFYGDDDTTGNSESDSGAMHYKAALASSGADSACLNVCPYANVVWRPVHHIEEVPPQLSRVQQHPGAV